MREGWAGRGWGSGFLGVLIFSGSLPATRVAVAGFSPLFLTSARAVIAALLGAACLALLRQKPPEQRDLGPHAPLRAQHAVVQLWRRARVCRAGLSHNAKQGCRCDRRASNPNSPGIARRREQARKENGVLIGNAGHGQNSLAWMIIRSKSDTSSR